VKPAPFAYHRPRSREEVDNLLAELGAGAKLLAGGQSLIPILNMRLAAPEHLIDLNFLEDEPVEPVLEAGARGSARWCGCGWRSARRSSASTCRCSPRC